MLRRLTKKRAFTALGVMAVLAVAGAAFAYFTSEGTGSTEASVGSATTWNVKVESAGEMFPGVGESDIAYTVTNEGKGNQGLAGTEVTVASEAGNILSGGKAVSGCKAEWFKVAYSSISGDLAAGESKKGTATVTMIDAEEDQNACQGKTPEIDVKAF
jgi:hypothetical protein